MYLSYFLNCMLLVIHSLHNGSAETSPTQTDTHPLRTSQSSTIATQSQPAAVTSKKSSNKVSTITSNGSAGTSPTQTDTHPLPTSQSSTIATQSQPAAVTSTKSSTVLATLTSLSQVTTGISAPTSSSSSTFTSSLLTSDQSPQRIRTTNDLKSDASKDTVVSTSQKVTQETTTRCDCSLYLKSTTSTLSHSQSSKENNTNSSKPIQSSTSTTTTLISLSSKQLTNKSIQTLTPSIATISESTTIKTPTETSASSTENKPTPASPLVTNVPSITTENEHPTASPSVTKVPSITTENEHPTASPSVTNVPSITTENEHPTASPSVTNAPSITTENEHPTASPSVTNAPSITTENEHPTASPSVTNAPSITTKNEHPTASPSVTNAPSITTKNEHLTASPSVTNVPSITTENEHPTASPSVTNAPSITTKNELTPASPSIANAPSITTKNEHPTASPSVTNAPSMTTKNVTITPPTTTIPKTTTITQSILTSPLQSNTSTKPLRRRHVRRDVSLDDGCYSFCVKEWGLHITTTGNLPTTPRHRDAYLDRKTIVITLVVVVNGNFSEVPKNELSSEYTDFTEKFKRSLLMFYNSTGVAKWLKDIHILGFSPGSIICNYTLETKAPANISEESDVLEVFRQVEWSSFKVEGIPKATVDVNRTKEEQLKLLSNDSIKALLSDSICGSHDQLQWNTDENEKPVCIYKCDLNKDRCGSHGTCYTTYEGDVKCRCVTDSNVFYEGDTCQNKHTIQPPITEPVPHSKELSKTEIIAIAAGTGGGLVLILLIALVCVCEKLQSAKKKSNFYSYSDDNEALHSENSRIENVPDIRNDYTNLEYQQDSDQMQMQRFEPEGKNVEHESRQHTRNEQADKSYRQIAEPDVGNVLIYQPTHLKEPLDRHSGASKFDSDEDRKHAYQMVDTETPYKIRRPTINTDQNIPYN